MKYKAQVIRYQKVIEQIKLVYILHEIEMKKRTEDFENRIKWLEKTMSRMNPAPQSLSEKIQKENRKTKIHLISTYTNNEELMEGLEIVRQVTPLGIFDEINIEIPIRNINAVK